MFLKWGSRRHLFTGRKKVSTIFARKEKITKKIQFWNVYQTVAKIVRKNLCWVEYNLKSWEWLTSEADMLHSNFFFGSYKRIFEVKSVNLSYSNFTFKPRSKVSFSLEGYKSSGSKCPTSAEKLSDSTWKEWKVERLTLQGNVWSPSVIYNTRCCGVWPFPPFTEISQ